jgi:hypothetical protein
MVTATLVQLPTGLSLGPENVTSTAKLTTSRPCGASLQTGAGNSTYMPFLGGAGTTEPKLSSWNLLAAVVAGATPCLF